MGMGFALLGPHPPDMPKVIQYSAGYIHVSNLQHLEEDPFMRGLIAKKSKPTNS